eukprot:4379781-Alexandrium_andersonii.AAC.1
MTPDSGGWSAREESFWATGGALGGGPAAFAGVRAPSCEAAGGGGRGGAGSAAGAGGRATGSSHRLSR